MALLGLGLVTTLVRCSVRATPEGRLHLTMLDVGSGDALGRHLPLERRLDWLVVAGTSAEQIAALPNLLPRFTPD